MERSDSKYLIRLIIRAFHFIVYGNLYIAGAATAVAYATRILFDHYYGFTALYPFIFCATLFIYSLDRVADHDNDSQIESPRIRWNAKHYKLLILFTISSVLGLAATLPFLPIILAAALIPLGAATLLYSFSIPGTAFSLKRLYCAKTLIVAIVWAGATAYLPMLEASHHVFGFNPVIILERILFVFALTVPFESRDLDRDALAGVRSIAHMIGYNGSAYLSTLIVLILLIFVPVHYSVHGSQAYIWGATYTISAVVLFFSGRKELPDWYYSLVVDGMLFLPAVGSVMWHLLEK